LYSDTFENGRIPNPEAGTSNCAIRQEGHEQDIAAGCDGSRSSITTERAQKWRHVVTSVVHVHAVAFTTTAVF